MSDKTPKYSTPSGAGQFATTRWSVILAAGDSASTQHEPALDTLCQTYWFPLYAYLRRRGYDTHQAEDYTQGFFAGILERKGLKRADPKCGKFRSFLLASLKNFLADEWDRARAQKRGGDKKVLSLDFDAAASRYDLEPADHLSPEKLFERSWALTVLTKAMDRLKAESAASDKQRLFDCLKVYLTAGKDAGSYRDVAGELNMTEGSVKVAVHRLRRRYRELVREEIAQTVTTEAQVDEEIRDLFAALA
ncbi:MAG TPA: sigma-70 family RNA polymerase sigma factor [Sedimentisphaerales bacterium]|nr:sigma-70 family RNA polymerase sigma factor [Sedimentisphaerales bacterium]